MPIDYNRPFAWLGQRLDPQYFEKYIENLDMSWARRVIIHHTWKPTVESWAGFAGMTSLRRHYLSVEDGTWDSGPHLFLAAGTRHDGIWLGTPLTRPGIHSGSCNRDGIGVEVVGNYDNNWWPEPVENLVFMVIVALLRKLKQPVTPETLKGHRECLPNKSCPGNAIDMDGVRLIANRQLAKSGDLQVIAGPTFTPLDAIHRSLTRHFAPISREEIDRVYALCQWLQVDPAFLVSWWIRKGKTIDGYESLQLWFFSAAIDVKQVCGSRGFVTVRQILEAYKQPALANSILGDIAYIRSH